MRDLNCQEFVEEVFRELPLPAEGLKVVMTVNVAALILLNSQ